MLTLNIRRRSSMSETIEQVHARFISFIDDLDSAWSLKGVENITLKERSPVEVVPLTKVLPNGVSGRLTYTNRVPKFLYDQSVTDDAIVLDIKGKKISYDKIVEIFLAYTEAFKPYRGQVIDEKLLIEDFPAINRFFIDNNREADGRWGIYRFGVCNYFDDELLTRSFGKTSKDVFLLMTNENIDCRLINSGVAFWVPNLPSELDEWRSLDAYFRKILAE